MTREQRAGAGDDTARAEIAFGEVSCSNGSVGHSYPPLEMPPQSNESLSETGRRKTKLRILQPPIRVAPGGDSHEEPDHRSIRDLLGLRQRVGQRRAQDYHGQSWMCWCPATGRLFARWCGSNAAEA